MTLTIETLSGETKVMNVSEVRISDHSLEFKVNGESKRRYMLVSEVADITIAKTLNDVAKELVEA
jgi:hypothetical protein